ncbi:phasin family protein [Azospirillum picis]|uniref:Phasin domain-containing protein n=1 Tax=Azospirillum picis TaxID=488438 RepID=A0ABU0MG54_9PROT|nr:phasin family protein [Azospirillum picis]MBP2298533.1 hypothetical protein [Azospirillum picis]MDQ0532418.1 hypothetical protein [Azospirillum picis]
MATEKDITTPTREATSKGRSAVEEMSRSGEAATRLAADAARSIGDQAIGTGRKAAEAGIDASHRMMDAGTGMSRQGAEAARGAMGSAADMASRTSEQFQRALGMSRDAQGEVSAQARETLDVMVQCGTVLADGWQTAWREWMGLAQEVAARNAEGVNALMRSRTIPDFYAVQSSMLKDNMQMVLNRSVKISELSARTASDAVGKLNTRMEDAAGQADQRI